MICGGRERCGADRQFCKNGKVIGWGDAGRRDRRGLGDREESDEVMTKSTVWLSL